MILNDLSVRLTGFQTPVIEDRGTDPNNRWRVASCMQKAIRFSNVGMAQFAASILCDLDKTYLFRRLGVVAVEDIGAGSIYSMLASLAALSSSSWRETADPRRLGTYLATLMAQSPKDRTCVDILIIADFAHHLDKAALARKKDDDLVDVITDARQPLELRACCAWLLAGTKRFAGETMPASNDRDPGRLYRLMVELGLSRAMLYLAAKTASRISEAMFVSFIFMDEFLRGSQPTIEPTSMPGGLQELVGKLLGAAYDMHTREGQHALNIVPGRLKNELEPFLKHCHAGMRRTFMGFGMFVAEGGML
ncbi:hypothetical protein, partial [Shinella sp.]|uniref:hypothetical protein n=1 Tax=Shinella sp. TaxID=1870904 RepID=UPI0039E2C723